MKRKKDKDITASSVSLKQFLAIFVAVLFTCGNYHIIYIRYCEAQSDKQNTFPGVALGLLLVVSLIGAVLIGVFKKFSFDKPVRTIADAARKVAEGDFSVRMPPYRKDGKKDHIEVLIEDFNTMVQELTTIRLPLPHMFWDIILRLETSVRLISKVFCS